MTDRNEQQVVQDDSPGKAMIYSIFDTVFSDGGANDLLWKFATRVYSQQPWIGVSMRAALIGKDKNCPWAAVDMLEAVVAEADRRNETELAATFREHAVLMRSQAFLMRSQAEQGE
jgi:hypothetical protein